MGVSGSLRVMRVFVAGAGVLAIGACLAQRIPREREDTASVSAADISGAVYDTWSWRAATALGGFANHGCVAQGNGRALLFGGYDGAGARSEAAKKPGISRSTLIARMVEYDLSRPRRR